MDKRKRWTLARRRRLIETFYNTNLSINDLAVQFNTNHTFLAKKIKELGFVKKTIYVRKKL